MHNFEKLNVYQRGLNMVDDIYEITKKYPKDEMFLLINQFRRAAVSVVLNIAEGSGRSKKEFIHFLNMSRTSAYECTALAQISLGRKYIDEEKYNYLYNELEVIIKMINKLKNSIA
ncbi:MAG: four helix bundle protein [Candidatus Moranbacteria bacterium]|jgi:four helix bundle protein|nr:four helix bundle protein [Candidatus Moranbacteria bacterium]